MLNLHINARFLTQSLSGTQRYAHQILQEFDKHIPSWPREVRVVAWCPKGLSNVPPWKNIEIREAGWSSGHAWEQTELAMRARDGWLINLISSGPLLHPRQIVTFHDAAIFDQPENFSKTYRVVHRNIRPALAKIAKSIITVSEFSKLSLSKSMNVPSGKFTIVPNGSDHLLYVDKDKDTLKRRGLKERRYVLFVGNEAPHKNVKTAIEAFTALKHPNLQFVTVGIGRSAIFGNLDVQGIESIVRLNDVADSELRALYEHAAMLVFPSRYEGFGIPPLEAMGLGCPVIASNAGAIPEVVGDAALKVDPDDVESWSKYMRKIMEDDLLRQEMIEKGYKQASLYTWEKAGLKFNNFVKSLIL